MNASKQSIVFSVLLFCLALGLTDARGAWAAADPDDRCGAGKLKAAGSYAKSLLSCESKAAQKNQPVDANCQAKASGKLTSGFDKSESKGGCATVGDEGSVATAVEGDVALVVAAIS